MEWEHDNCIAMAVTPRHIGHASVDQTCPSLSISGWIAVALLVAFLADGCRSIQGNPAQVSGFEGNSTSGIVGRRTYPGLESLCDSLMALFGDLPDSMKDSAAWMIDDHTCRHGRTGCCLQVVWTYDPLESVPSPLDRLQLWLKRSGWKFREECFAVGPGVTQTALERGEFYCLLTESGGIGDLSDTLSIDDGFNFLRACFVPTSPSTGTIDCAEKYRDGFFGVSVSDSVFASGALRVQGWQPVAVEKHSRFGTPEECAFTILSDIYRLVYDQGPHALVAGCYGDFNGDTIRDYSLLLKREEDGLVLPHAFVSSGTTFRVFPLRSVFAKYGFDEDRSIPPGPVTTETPDWYYFADPEAERDLPEGIDYIQVGWNTYFWNGVDGFVLLWTAD